MMSPIAEGRCGPLTEDRKMFDKAENPHVEEETITDQRRQGYQEAYVTTEAAKQMGIENTDIPHGPTFKDLTGMQFGKWRVLRYVKSTPHGSLYECLCTCGACKMIWGSQLTAGRSQSCGKPGCRVRRGKPMSEKDALPFVEPGDERLFRIWCELLELNNASMWRCKADGSIYPISKVSAGLRDWKTFMEWSYTMGYNDKKVLCNKGEEGILMLPINESLPDGPKGVVMQMNNVEWIYPEQAEDEGRLVVIKPVKERYYKDPTDGHVYTRAQLAEKYGMKLSTFNSRLSRGWSIEKTCLGPRVPFKCVADPNVQIWKN